MKKFLAVFSLLIIFLGTNIIIPDKACGKCRSGRGYSKTYGLTTTYYDKDCNVTGKTRRSADGTISYYDKDGKRIHKTKRVVHKRRPIKRSSKIVYTYDRNGEKTGGYKRYGNTTTQYDKHGNVIGKTRRSVNGSVFYYDEKGRKTRSLKRSFTGRISEYDKNNRRIGVYR